MTTDIETESQIRERIPDWANAVMCPRCFSVMTPIRRKRGSDRWGVTITFQCHGKVGEKMCLLVNQLTTSVSSVMYPEDFGEFDFDWRKVAESVPDRSEDEPKALELPTRPAHPFSRENGKAIVWRCFWDIWEENGAVDADLLLETSLELAEKDATKRAVAKSVETLTKWMGDLSHYRFVLQGRKFVFAGSL